MDSGESASGWNIFVVLLACVFGACDGAPGGEAVRKGVTDRIRFGVSYCPYAKSGDADMDVWERDVLTMKKLNFNAIRCFVAWDRIEREEGRCDFSKLDYLFELADKHDMDVILNVGGVFACYGGIYPPRWLVRDKRCQHVVEDPQSAGQPFGPYRRICMDDPVFQAKAEEFTRTVIRRYGKHPRLFGWNVWNEAFSRPMCYCPLTLAKFRAWLKAEYNGDLNRLNELWGTEFPVLYRDWNEIEPGLGTGFLSNGYVARMDWLSFNQERVASWVNGVNRLVRENDPADHPTTSNIVASSVLGDPESHGFPDIWSQSHDLSIAGFSFYTISGTPSQWSAALGMVRGSSADPKRGFWVLETEGGQIGNSSLGPLNEEELFGRRRQTTLWLSALHGAKTILMWKFGGSRVTDNQTDDFNLTGWDGSITERAQRIAEVASEFRANESVFLDKSYRADVAILVSSQAHIFLQAEKTNLSNSRQARSGAWKMLRDLHVPGDLVNDVRILEGRLADYKVLIMPHSVSMTAELAAKLTEFVRAGGTVIADRRLVVHDENGRIFPHAPGHGLTNVFGGYINDYLLSSQTEMTFGRPACSITVPGRFRSITHPGPNTEVFGTYADGAPAVLHNRYGKGHTFWFGADLFAGYETKAQPEMAQVMKWMLARAGIITDYELVGEPAPELEIGALVGEDGERVHFLLNLSRKQAKFSLKINSAGNRVFCDLLSDFKYGGGDQAVPITLSPWGCMILAEPKR